MTSDEMRDAVKERLNDGTNTLLGNDAYDDCVAQGVLEYSARRPRILQSSLTLVADQADYTSPEHFISLLRHTWGRSNAFVPPWDRGTLENQVPVRRLPEIMLVNGKIHFDPAPTTAQISAWGSTLDFYFRASHQLTATVDTIPDHDKVMVKLVALAEACKEIAADSAQSEQFVQRYYTLAKRYRERFTSLIDSPAPATTRS